MGFPDCQDFINLGFSSVMMDGSLLEDQRHLQILNTILKLQKTVEIAH